MVGHRCHPGGGPGDRRTSRAAPIFIAGQITSGGKPLPDADVSLYVPDTAQPLLVTHTLSNGTYVLQIPAPGNYRITASDGNEYEPVSRALALPLTNSQDSNFSLIEAPHLSVRLLSPDGNPVTDRVVQVLAIALPKEAQVNGKAPPWMMGDASGFWTNRKPSAAGEVHLSLSGKFSPENCAAVGIGARAEGIGCARLTLQDWPQGTVTVRLEQGVNLGGTVRNTTGEPVAFAPVRAVGIGPNLFRRFLQGWADTTTDANGHFLIPSLFEDRYDVRVHLADDDIRYKTTTAAGPLTEIGVSARDRTAPPLDAHFYNHNFPPSGSSRFGLMRQSLQADPTSVAVTGKVTTHKDGETLTNGYAALYALTPGETTLADATGLKSDGTYALSAPGPGEYLFECGADGQSTVHNTLTVTGADSVNRDVHLRGAIPLKLLLLDPDGKPLKTGQITFWHWYKWPQQSGGSGSREQPIPEDGSVVFPTPDNVDDLQDCLVGAQVKGVGCGEWRFKQWPEQPLTRRLSKGALITGSVSGTGGQPAAGCRVTLSAQLRNPRLASLDERGEWQAAQAGSPDVGYLMPKLSTTTDVAGHFSIPLVVYGSYEIRAMIPKVGPRYHTLEVDATEIKIDLNSQDASTTTTGFPPE